MANVALHVPFVVLASASLLAAACSSSDGGSAQAGGCEAYGEAFVALTKRCSLNAGYSEPRWAAFAKRFELACTSVRALPGVAANDAFIGRCAAALRVAACGAEEVPECDSPAGTLDDGAPCATNDQCKSELCGKANATAGCGTCQARAAVGAACSATARCADDATCDPTSRTCVAIVRGAIGMACEPAKGRICEANAFCDTTSKTCTARAKVGESCGAAPCDVGLACSQDTGKCVASAIVSEGGSCGEGLTCGSGLSCVAGKCARATFVPPGGDCSATNARCEHGVCNTTTKKCPTVIEDGGACTLTSRDAICDDFASCKDGKCILPGQAVCK
jgi:hypothetical protein